VASEADGKGGGTPGAAPAGRTFALASAAVALSLVMSLGLAEAFLRLAGTAAVYRMGDFEIQLDRDLLFRVKPHCSPEVNALGYRDREFAADKKGRRRILFYGDSFVVGVGVPSGLALPKALERRLGPEVEVLNLGVYGYGPDQSYAAFTRDGPGLHPDVVLLGLFPGNDFEDLVKNELFVPGGAGRLERSRVNPVEAVLPRSALVLKARMALTGRFLPAEEEEELIKRLVMDPFTPLGSPGEAGTRRRLELMDGVLGMWKSEMARRKIPYGVVVFPNAVDMKRAAHPGTDGTPPERMFLNEEVGMALVRKAGLQALDLRDVLLSRPDLVLFNERDLHLSAAGNDLAASAVAEFVKSLR
jgi:hypothetical protein